jgi:hypothetical protein
MQTQEEYRTYQREYKKRRYDSEPGRRSAIVERSRNYRRVHLDRTILSQAKTRCKKSGILFNLTIKDIVIPDVCPILGIPIYSNVGEGRTDNSPSIDRVYPDLGYVSGNVVIVSDRANRIKNDGTASEHRLIADWIEKNGRI